MIFTGEAIFSKDINAVKQVNINESDPAGVMMGPDNRQYWTTQQGCQHSRKRNGAYKYRRGLSDVIDCTADKELQKRLSGMFAYTYTQAKDITANPGSSAYSAFSSNTSVTSLNNPGSQLL